MNTRIHLHVLTAGLVICLIGGALLFSKVYETAQSNSKFICTFGAAISKKPLKPRNAETDKEFRMRVRATRQFVAQLESELDDCDQPTVIAVDPDAKKKLHKGGHSKSAISNTPNSKGSKGGGQPSAGPPPSQPGPPPSGGGSPPANPGPPNQPSPNPPPETPGTLDPVLDATCDLTTDVGLPVCP